MTTTNEQDMSKIESDWLFNVSNRKFLHVKGYGGKERNKVNQPVMSLNFSKLLVLRIKMINFIRVWSDGTSHLRAQVEGVIQSEKFSFNSFKFTLPSSLRC